MMLSTIVDASQGTAQVLFIVAAVIAFALVVLALRVRDWTLALSGTAVVLLSLGLLFHA